MTEARQPLNRRTALAALAASGAAIVATPALAAASRADATVEAAIEKLRIAMLEGDGAALGALLRDDLAYMHSSGHSQTKADLLRDLAGKRFFAGLTNSEVTIDVVGSAAVATMLVDQVKNLPGGKTRSSRIKIMQTWVRPHGSWELLARMSAIISSPLAACSAFNAAATPD